MIARVWKPLSGSVGYWKYLPSQWVLTATARFRLRGLDDSVRAAAGRKVLRERVGMRGIQYNFGKSLAMGPLG